MIYYGRFENSYINLLIVKEYIYAVSDDGTLFCFSKINEINNNLSVLIPIKDFDSYNYYVIAIKNSNNKINFFLYKNYPSQGCVSENILSKEYNITINSDNFNCHYKNKLICFYENESNEIIASIFDIDLINIKIEYASSYSKTIGGIKIIKSIFLLINLVFTFVI